MWSTESFKGKEKGKTCELFAQTFFEFLVFYSCVCEKPLSTQILTLLLEI